MIIHTETEIVHSTEFRNANGIICTRNFTLLHNALTFAHIHFLSPFNLRPLPQIAPYKFMRPGPRFVEWRGSRIKTYSRHVFAKYTIYVLDGVDNDMYDDSMNLVDVLLRFLFISNLSHASCKLPASRSFPSVLSSCLPFSYIHNSVPSSHIVSGSRKGIFLQEKKLREKSFQNFGHYSMLLKISLVNACVVLPVNFKYIFSCPHHHRVSCIQNHVLTLPMSPPPPASAGLVFLQHSKVSTAVCK